MKKILSLGLALLLIWALALPVMGAETHLLDEAGVITDPDQIAAIENQAETLAQTYGIRVYFLYTQSEDEDLYSRLEARYQDLAGSADGILFGHDLGSKILSVYTAGKLNSLTDTEKQTLYDRYDGASTFYGGVRNYLTELDSLCRARFGGSADPRLFDYADLLSDSEEQRLLTKLDQVSGRLGMDVTVATVEGTDGFSVRDYADDFYDYHSYANDGVLLLISMAERDWYVSTKGYAMEAIGESWEYIGDEITSDLSDGDYYDAFSRYADLCEEITVQYKETGKPYKKPLSKIWILIAAGVGLIAGAAGTGKMKGELKSVRYQTNANQYLRPGSLNLTDSRDTFLYTHVTRTEIPRDTGSRSGGGGHVSSSGSSHGGGGGKF